MAAPPYSDKDARSLPGATDDEVLQDMEPSLAGHSRWMIDRGGPRVTRRRGSVISDRSGAAIIGNITFAQRTETDPAPQKIGRSPRRGCVVSCGSGQGRGGLAWWKIGF